MGKGGHLWSPLGGIKTHKQVYGPRYEQALRYVEKGEYQQATNSAEYLSRQNSTVARGFADDIRKAIEKAQAAKKK